ncbi:alpha/beta hydrolase [Pseudoalteromonas sp. MTN2-4]|uniref:alpha/beta hydrolase n=1 Tax=Pseudoalteromonas sp. MTN2-4 TaxID=3056555 RepID=UPI0036F1F030
MKKLISLSAALLLSFNSFAGEVYSEFPTQIKPQEKYIFYSHGYIVEGDNPKPVNTKNGWGLYDFPAIKAALADESYNLIAFHRSKNTDPYKYAYELNKQIRSLVAQGVDAKNITIMGFSKGAFITGLTSDKVSDLGVNTILLAGCGRLVFKQHTDIKVYGRVLSIYEKTDKANTCKALKTKSTQAESFEEIAINTGLEHGAFYRPIPEWVKPVKRWIKAL